MISEKTVELNITTELVNWLYVITGFHPYILAPSQRQEGVLGFDVSVGYPDSGTSFLLQYKRAEFRKRRGEYVYHLNNTAGQDQHARLFWLEKKGWDVFYVLPLFHLPYEVVAHRQHLLPKTLYLRPGSMVPAGGLLTGPHEVRYQLSTGRITIHSEQGREVFEYLDHNGFLQVYRQQESDRPLEDFMIDFDAVFANRETIYSENTQINAVSEQDYFLFNGLAAIIK